MENKFTPGPYEASSYAKKGKYPALELDINAHGFDAIATIWCEKEEPSKE